MRSVPGLCQLFRPLGLRGLIALLFALSLLALAWEAILVAPRSVQFSLLRLHTPWPAVAVVSHLFLALDASIVARRLERRGLSVAGSLDRARPGVGVVFGVVGLQSFLAVFWALALGDWEILLYGLSLLLSLCVLFAIPVCLIERRGFVDSFRWGANRVTETPFRRMGILGVIWMAHSITFLPLGFDGWAILIASAVFARWVNASYWRLLVGDPRVGK